MRRIVTLSAVALLLAACAPEAPGGGESAPPADAPAPAPDASAPAEPSPPAEAEPIALSALGTEPFWRVDITNDEFKLTRPDAPAQTARRVAVAVGTGYISLVSGPSPNVHASFTKGECSDGMSDLKYPYKVEIRWGAETLKGCGFPTAEQPREGQ